MSNRGDSVVVVRVGDHNSSTTTQPNQNKSQELAPDLSRSLEPEHRVQHGTTFEWNGPHKFLQIRLNPIVTIASVVLIWGFVAIMCILATHCGKENPRCRVEVGDELGKVKEWITDVWTWLYIGTQDFWALFIVVLYCSKYGKMTLGKVGEKPEFNNATYFTMLFAAGVGIGLFFFGVAEPVYHYSDKTNRYYGRYTDNLRAQDAINITFFHWGIHGWIVYVLVGLLLGFIAYRNDLPMTMRSCFYPLLGDVVWGFAGDLVDILSVICTMFGVCTSLGLGVIQFNAGLHRVNPNIKENITNQIIIIWAITACATASVVSGVKVGIRRLSEICFSVGMFVMLIVFFRDETWYLLNVLCQSVGYYFQWIVQLGFHTDAFVSLKNAPDKRESVTWMDSWTMFYWGWWIAWSPFVGMFIARISKGRTIREFIHYTLTIPITYTFLWFAIFGGAGLRMERDAQNVGLGVPNCDVANATQGYTTEDGRVIYRLSCRGTTNMWFDVVTQYGDIGPFMSILSLAGILLYFVTSSDSGSLIIDCLSANGDPEPPVIQRFFWAITEGACATALLVAGGRDALEALQSVSICAGLFYTIILNFMCVALWRSLKIAAGDLDPNGPKWTMGLLDPFFRWSWWKKAGNPLRMLIAIFAPWWPMSRAAERLYGGKRWIYMLVLAIPFYLCFILLAFEPLVDAISYIGWAIFFGFVAYGMALRTNIREEYGILGNMAEDVFAVLLVYPCAALQMDHQLEHGVNSERPGPRTKIGDRVAERKIFWMLRVAARRQAFRPARGYSKQPKDFANRH